MMAKKRARSDHEHKPEQQQEGQVGLHRNAEIRSEKNLGDGVAWFRGAMIGKGSFGSVYLANLKKPRTRYGCFPSIMAIKSAEVSDSGSIQKEREVLSKVCGCPNVIQCFGEETTTGKNGEMVYNLLLEYCSGGTLANLIKKSGGNGLSEFEVKRHTRSILLGLNHIHEFGYVHCDLKPENIFLVPTNNNDANSFGTQFTVKIGDFGLSKRNKQIKKRKLDPYWRGTPMYLSPETVVDGIQEAPSDIWALGCTVLEMLTGKPPWDDPDTESILSKIGGERELPKIPSEISKEGKDFLKSCFVRKSVYRLTADMLLNHPFIEGLMDNFESEGPEENSDISKICSSSFCSDTEEDELSSSYFSDDSSIVSEEESFSDCSEDVGEVLNSQRASNFAEEGTSEFQQVMDIKSSSIGVKLNNLMRHHRRLDDRIQETKCTSTRVV